MCGMIFYKMKAGTHCIKIEKNRQTNPSNRRKRMICFFQNPFGKRERMEGAVDKG